MKKNVILKFSILSVYFVITSAAAVNPALARIAAAFPTVPFTTILLVSTLPSLLAVPFTLLAGRLAGSVVKFKTLIIFGMTLFLFGGITPYFLTSNIGVIIAMRAIYGIGLGVITPLGMSLVIAFFDGEARAKMLGTGIFVQSVGGVIFTLLSGIMAAVTWNLFFLIHALGLITLVLILFFLPEPDKVDQQSGDSVPKMPGIVYLYTALVFVAMMPVVPLMLNMSSFMETTKLGDAAAAGLVLAMFTVGGMIAGVIFSQIYKLFKRNTISFGIVLLAAAMVCMIYGSTILFMFMASLFAGIGITIIIPAIFMILGTKVHPARMSTVSGLVLSAINVVGIPTPYIFTFISKLFNQTDNFKFPYMLGIICYAILIIGYMLIKPKTIDKTQVQ